MRLSLPEFHVCCNWTIYEALQRPTDTEQKTKIVSACHIINRPFILRPAISRCCYEAIDVDQSCYINSVAYMKHVSISRVFPSSILVNDPSPYNLIRCTMVRLGVLSHVVNSRSKATVDCFIIVLTSFVHKKEINRVAHYIANKVQ